MPLPEVSEDTLEIIIAENQSPDWTDEVLERLDQENPVLSNFFRGCLKDLDDATLGATALPTLVFYEAIRTEIANQDLKNQFG